LVQKVICEQLQSDRANKRAVSDQSRSKMAVMAPGKNRIMIFGPKDDGTYVVEFRSAAGEVLAISIPRTETALIRHFQERMPYGIFVPELPSDWEKPD
jgi:hypothetical protein